MSDTTKSLEAKIAQMEKEREKKQKQMDLVREKLDATKMTFMEGGHKADQLDNDPEGQKLNAEVTKLQHLYDEVAAAYTGLGTKIKAVTAALDQYKSDKAGLKEAKKSGDIDKDEYTRRKNVCKEMLKDVGTVKEAEVRKLNDRADAKKKELATVAAKADEAASISAEAKKFVDDGLPGEAKKVMEKCMKFFGKKNLNPEQAKSALKKLDEGVKSLEKEKRILESEVAAVEAKVQEGVERIKQYQQDIQRSLVSYQEGNLDQQELDRVMANFKETLAIK
jgi:chromosome segregation ATPase